MHKQKEYFTAHLDPQRTVAILYNTAICQIISDLKTGERRLILNNGGHITRSTVKAMNGFLCDNHVPWSVHIRKGEMRAVHKLTARIELFIGEYATIWLT